MSAGAGSVWQHMEQDSEMLQHINMHNGTVSMGPAYGIAVTVPSFHVVLRTGDTTQALRSLPSESVTEDSYSVKSIRSKEMHVFQLVHVGCCETGRCSYLLIRVSSMMLFMYRYDFVEESL
jgi:hypothetical protein